MTLRATVNRAYDLAIVAPAALSALVPYRWRWSVLVAIGAVLTPFAGAIGRYGPGYSSVGLVTHREYALFYLLARATQLGIGFAPALSHDGLDALDAALSEGGPVLIAGVHAPLLYLAGRYLIERGCDVVAFRDEGAMPVIGRPGSEYPGLEPGESIALLRLARAMTPGRVITALIDHAPGRRAETIAIGPIRVNVAWPLLKLAADTGTVVLFFHPRLERGRVRIRWRRGDTVAAFADFLRADSPGA